MSERGEIEGQCNHSTYYNLLAGMKSFTMLPMAHQVGKLNVFPKEVFFLPSLSFLFSSLQVLEVVKVIDTTVLCHFFNLELGFQIHPAPVCILEETFCI